jgi:hypothetical protein
VLPKDIPEFKFYSNVYAFVSDHLSMQFGDVRCMMRLPIPILGISHACNFAVAAILCNLISGISVSLYMPVNPIKINEKGERRWVSTGETFKLLLENFYPWESGKNGKTRARVLYNFVRNPFAHALGVHGKTYYKIKIMWMSIVRNKKQLPTGLQEGQLEEIERSPTRPTWLSPGFSGAGRQWDLLAEGFYRDVFHMLWNLAKDKKQMNEAEKRFSKGQIIWREGIP